MNKGTIIKLALTFGFYIGFLSSNIAQTTPSLGPAINSNTATKAEKAAKAKEYSQSRANSTRSSVQTQDRAQAAALGRNRGNVKTVYGFLYQDREGTVILDRGEGQTPVMKTDTRTAYKSIVAALNFLSNEQQWRIMHNYDLTNNNPRPSFLLIKQIREE